MLQRGTPVWDVYFQAAGSSIRTHSAGSLGGLGVEPWSWAYWLNQASSLQRNGQVVALTLVMMIALGYWALTNMPGAGLRTGHKHPCGANTVIVKWPFYRQENWGLESLHNLSTATQICLAGDRTLKPPAFFLLPDHIPTRCHEQDHHQCDDVWTAPWPRQNTFIFSIPLEPKDYIFLIWDWEIQQLCNRLNCWLLAQLALTRYPWPSHLHCKNILDILPHKPGFLTFIWSQLLLLPLITLILPLIFC